MVHEVSMLLGLSHTELSSSICILHSKLQLADSDVMREHCQALALQQKDTFVLCSAVPKPLQESSLHAVFHITSHTLSHINPKAKMAVMGLSVLSA